MNVAARKGLKLYGAWSLLMLSATEFGSAFCGHGEYGIFAHILLIVTGLPLSLLSLHILPNGGALAVLAAGLIGTAQWAIVSEANARWEHWRKSRPGKRSPPLLARTKFRWFWLAALAAPLASAYALFSAIFYARLNASGSWPADGASLWAGVAFAFCCLFGAVSVISVVRLVRHYNSLPQLPDR